MGSVLWVDREKDQKMYVLHHERKTESKVNQWKKIRVKSKRMAIIQK